MPEFYARVFNKQLKSMIQSVGKFGDKMESGTSARWYRLPVRSHFGWCITRKYRSTPLRKISCREEQGAPVFKTILPFR
jgi:hypothetical protein